MERVDCIGKKSTKKTSFFLVRPDYFYYLCSENRWEKKCQKHGRNEAKIRPDEQCDSSSLVEKQSAAEVG